MEKSIKCPQCNEINEDRRQFCIICGTSLVGIPREQSKTSEQNQIQKSNNTKSTAYEARRKYPHLYIGMLLGFIFFFIGLFPFGRNIFCCMPAWIIAGLLTGFITGRYAKIENGNSASSIGLKTGGMVGLFIFLGQITSGILFLLLDISMVLELAIVNSVIALIVTPIVSSITASKTYN